MTQSKEGIALVTTSSIIKAVTGKKLPYFPGLHIILGPDEIGAIFKHFEVPLLWSHPVARKDRDTR
jgi:hypothetical protein